MYCTLATMNSNRINQPEISYAPPRAYQDMTSLLGLKSKPKTGQILTCLRLQVWIGEL